LRRIKNAGFSSKEATPFFLLILLGEGIKLIET